MNHVCVSVDVQKREFELVSGNVIVFLKASSGHREVLVFLLCPTLK